MVNAEDDMTLVAAVSTGAQGIKAFRALKPDVTLMDLRLPDLNGIDAMAAILADFPEARIIVVTTFDGDVEIHRCLELGAHGYLLKSMSRDDMLASIRKVHAGKKAIPPQIAAGLAEHLSDELLSQREVEVLRHVAEGKQNRAVAQKLFISEDTVKVHMKHILNKLGAHDRTQAVAIAVRRGIIHL